ncbi:cer [Drosophila busckii]|uniref:Cer n=1 Tax=Drosophila busckii TaxID=30019 RepID=A0A0M5J9V3_DROBS|nr:cer [Drosophila busckii]
MYDQQLKEATQYASDFYLGYLGAVHRSRNAEGTSADAEYKAPDHQHGHMLRNANKCPANNIGKRNTQHGSFASKRTNQYANGNANACSAQIQQRTHPTPFIIAWREIVIVAALDGLLHGSRPANRRTQAERTKCCTTSSNKLLPYSHFLKYKFE